jgi:hypothetical protein
VRVTVEVDPWGGCAGSDDAPPGVGFEGGMGDPPSAESPGSGKLLFKEDFMLVFLYLINVCPFFRPTVAKQENCETLFGRVSENLRILPDNESLKN